MWQSGNVYLPTPDGGRYNWVSDYVQELIGFPNAEHDDQVDATTQALNQLKGTLFPESKQCVVTSVEARPLPGRYYTIAWVPTRLDNKSTLLVYDVTKNAVVHFERIVAEPIDEVEHVFKTSVKFDNASVRAVDGFDESMLKAVEYKGVTMGASSLTRRSSQRRTRTSACSYASALFRTRIFLSSWRNSRSLNLTSPTVVLLITACK